MADLALWSLNNLAPLACGAVFLASLAVMLHDRWTKHQAEHQAQRQYQAALAEKHVVATEAVAQAQFSEDEHLDLVILRSQWRNAPATEH